MTTTHKFPSLEDVHDKAQVGVGILPHALEAGVEQGQQRRLVLVGQVVLVEPGRQLGLPVQAGGGHVDHPVAGDRGRGGVVHVPRLEDDLDVGGQVEPGVETYEL